MTYILYSLSLVDCAFSDCDQLQNISCYIISENKKRMPT